MSAPFFYLSCSWGGVDSRRCVVRRALAGTIALRGASLSSTVRSVAENGSVQLKAFIAARLCAIRRGGADGPAGCALDLEYALGGQRGGCAMLKASRSPLRPVQMVLYARNRTLRMLSSAWTHRYARSRSAHNRVGASAFGVLRS